MSSTRPSSPVSVLESNDIHEEARLRPPASPVPSFATTLRGSTIAELPLKTDIEIHDIPPKNDNISNFSLRQIANDEALSSGHQLKQSRESKILLWSVNIVLLILPLSFLVLAFLAVNLDGSTHDVSRDWVLQVAQIGPTIYPIMFAAIMGRLMCDIALYRAERGIRLGTVEQLVQSTSLAGSIKAAFMLRNRSVWGLLIIFVWCFSPIGGQSSLRCLAIGHASSQQIITVLYASGLNVPSFSADDSIINSTLQAALFAPNTTKAGPQDSWQNPKMPFVPAVVYNSSNDSVSSSSWYEFEGRESNDYTSLIGIPIWNVTSRGNSNFTISGAFMYTDCQKHGVERFYELCGPDPPFNHSFCNTSDTMASQNAMFMFDWDGRLLNKTSEKPTYVKLNIITNCRADIPYNPEKFSSPNHCSAIFECDIKSRYVDVNMTCTDGICKASAVRRSLNVDTPDFITPWNEWLDIGDAARYKDNLTLENINKKFPTGQSVYNFLAGSDHPEFPNGLDFFLPNTSITNVSIRSTQLLNSYWLSNTYALDLFKPITHTAMQQNEYGNEDRIFYTPVSAKTSTDRLVYKARRIWVSILTYISLALLLCTIASIIMRLKTVSPDILGYVSSLTRDNQHFEHCQVGSTLDGLERARALQDTKVYVADVHPHLKTGRIAFSTGITDGMPHGRLSKERLYE